MNKTISDKEKICALNQFELRLYVLHNIRYGLLEQAHNIYNENKCNYDFYVEANEILNEIEHQIWKSIKIDG